jgi:hypothetical protein
MDGFADGFAAGGVSGCVASATLCELDIWRTAGLLLREHGYDALRIAVQRRDKLRADGDLDRMIVWNRIITAMDELTRARGDGERLN